LSSTALIRSQITRNLMPDCWSRIGRVQPKIGQNGINLGNTHYLGSLGGHK
jgi:hypothetical protein